MRLYTENIYNDLCAHDKCNGNAGKCKGNGIMRRANVMHRENTIKPRIHMQSVKSQRNMQ